MADKLIYANALKQALSVLFEEGSFCYVEDIINGQPTVDAEPVRHERWIENDDECECPLCGKAWDYFDNCTETFNFCPNCGAKMDKEEE